MSYCRFGEGDVYVFASGEGLTCMCCSMEPMSKPVVGESLFEGYSSSSFSMNEDFNCSTEGEMLAHLRNHIDAGDSVPQDAINRLEREVEQDER